MLDNNHQDMSSFLFLPPTYDRHKNLEALKNKFSVATYLDAIYMSYPVICQFDFVIRSYREDIVKEFFRRKFDPNYPVTQLIGRKAAKYRQLLNPTVDLWIAVYECLDSKAMTAFLQDIRMSSPEALLKLSCEANSLILPNTFAKDDYNGGATALLKEIQKQNGMLVQRENPFREGTFTWQVVQEMIAFSEQRKRFSPDFYTPIVKARGRLAQVIKESRPEVFTKDEETLTTRIPVRRGGNTTQRRNKGKKNRGS